jgi:predicted porin
MKASMKPISTRNGLLATVCTACTVFACMPATAQTTVTAYGEVRLTFNHIQTGSSSKVNELRDNASRLGFRGVEDLGGGLKALFGLEMGFGADTGVVGTPTFRNSYVALQGGWGTVALGRLDSANPTGSPLYSQITSLTSFAPNDAGATAVSTSMFNSRNRTSNSIGYASPKFGGLNLRARTYYRGAETATEPEDAAKGFDVGLNYEAGPWRAALGWGSDKRSGGLRANEFDNKWQAGLNYNFKPFDIYFVGGDDKYKNTATTRRSVKYGVLGGTYTEGPHKIVLNIMKRDVQSSLTGVRNRYQLSYQHFLSKRTQLQFFFDNDGIDSSRSNVRVKALGMGVRHNF